MLEEALSSTSEQQDTGGDEDGGVLSGDTSSMPLRHSSDRWCNQPKKPHEKKLEQSVVVVGLQHDASLELYMGRGTTRRRACRSLGRPDALAGSPAGPVLRIAVGRAPCGLKPTRCRATAAMDAKIENFPCYSAVTPGRVCGGGQQIGGGRP